MLIAKRKNTMMNSNRNSKLLFPLLMEMAVILCFLIDIPSNVQFTLSAALLCILLLLDVESSFYLLMFNLCVNELVSIGSVSIPIVFVALFSAKHFFSRKFKILIDIPMLVSLIILLLLGVLSTVLGIENQLLTTVKQIFFFCYAAVLLAEVSGRKKAFFYNTFRFAACGINFSCFAAVILSRGRVLLNRMTISPEVTINALGILCALCVVNLLYCMVVLKQTSVAADVMLILGCCVWGILTQSRSFFLAVIIGVVLLILLTSSLKRKSAFLVGLLFCIVIFIIAALIHPPILNRVLMAAERILNPRNDDITNGRTYIWRETIRGMYEGGHIWLGLGDYRLLNTVYLKKTEMAHNMFLETWVVYGYIGCAVLLAAFYFFMKRHIFSNAFRKTAAVTYIPAIVFLSIFFFSHSFIGGMTSLVFMISWIPLTLGKTKREKRNL